MLFFKKIYINFLSNKIKNKSIKRRWRRFELYKYTKNLKQQYKWGVSYSVFDGEELLEASIKSIRNSVDYINVVYQKHSWFGKPCSQNLETILNDLKSRGLIDELIEYKPNLKKGAVSQEREKRQIGLNYAIKAEVNYFMTMDCDEFYRKNDVEYAKTFIVKNNITYSFIGFVSYGITPTKRLDFPMRAGIQFFSKINRFSKLGKNKNIISVVDPTRNLSNINIFMPKIKQFYINGVEMHHMSYIRRDIDKKMSSSSANLKTRNFVEKFNKKVQNNKMKLIDVNDEFNILPIIESFKKM